MLVLHELYHVIFGHTRLFPRLTQTHNIVFDAVINALLCHQFSDAVYVRFFRQVNPSKKFPARLLKPPSGWPGKLKLPQNISEKERNVISRLYGQRPETVTYAEIIELLQKDAETEIQDDFVLIGDHGGERREGTKDRAAVGDPTIKEILRRVTEKWPQEAGLSNGRGKGGPWENYLMPKPKSPKIQFIEALKRLLAKAGVLHPLPGSPYAWKNISCGIETRTVLPDLRDRHSHAHEVLTGAMPFLYQSESIINRSRWRPDDVAHVYIDISGSMDDALPWLVGALDPLHRRGRCRLYAFSTVVDEVSRGKMTKGQVKNTYGTDIRCVYQHLIAFSPRRTPKRFVVLTDGYTGSPSQEEAAEIKNRGLQMYVGLVGPATKRDLQSYAKVIEHFPGLV